ncbi:hypothetical protein FJZ31_34190 [Candidatus Poribacteria bacterium]|nr:hypothetical protein [Candidatus Poribacteria bacterium]
MTTRTTIGESTEEKWLAEHPEICEEYIGEFIAILTEEIIAHGKNEQEVLEQADKVSDDYVLTYLYPREEMII